MFDKLIHQGEGKPVLRAKECFGDAAPNEFWNLPWSDWIEADLMGPVRYARGNNRLEVPHRWKKVFPPAFEYLAKKDQEARRGVPTEPFLPP